MYMYMCVLLCKKLPVLATTTGDPYMFDIDFRYTIHMVSLQCNVTKLIILVYQITKWIVLVYTLESVPKYQ